MHHIAVGECCCMWCDLSLMLRKADVLLSCFTGKKRRSEGVQTVTLLIHSVDIYIRDLPWGLENSRAKK